MLTSTGAGLVLILGHHLFYASLNGTLVDNTSLFNQQFNIGIGTAFAFLIKSCLVLAVGTSFTQLLWQDLLKKQIPVSRIDTITQILSSFFDLLNVKSLRRHKTIALIALISWMLPLAAIVPPATLSIGIPEQPVPVSQQLSVAKLSFSRSTYEAPGDPPAAAGVPSSGTTFKGPSGSLKTLALLTAISREIPAMVVPLNSSYSLTFDGPALQCVSMPTTILDAFDPLFHCKTRYPLDGLASAEICFNAIKYLAWVPSNNQRIPFVASNESWGPNFNGWDFAGAVGSVLPEPAAIYIATQTPALTYSPEEAQDNWSVLNCSFYHATYTVDFSADVNGQHLQIERELHRGFNYSDMVDQFYCKTDGGRICLESHTDVILTPEYVAYQSLMATFGNIMVGYLYDSLKSAVGNWKSDATWILSTKLTDCYEIDEKSNNTLPLARAVEQLFENMTMALFSRSQYTVPLNSTEAMTEIIFQTYPNTYVYSWRRLLLSYGIGVLFTLICVLVGGYTMLASGNSYSHTFSTIVRTTRGPAWDDSVSAHDRHGQDPLPRCIGKTTMPVGQCHYVEPQVGNDGNSEGGGATSSIQKEPKSPVIVEDAAYQRNVVRNEGLIPTDQVSLMSSISGTRGNS